MIIIVDALNKQLFGGVLQEMHKLRARVFSDRLGWDVQVIDGMEMDEFDALNPAHVISLNDDGDVVGCMRLLQTTGPHMLADVFSAILDGEPPLRSAQVWEATRFCVDTTKLRRGDGKNTISYVTSEVMIGAFEYAQEAGVLDAVAVIDPVMDRVMQRSGNAPTDYLGSAKPMGKVTAMAALMDCSDERIASIRNYSDIRHDVFLTEQQALERFARRAVEEPAPTALATPAANHDHKPMSALERYFAEQMAAAQNDQEVQAVTDLIDALSDTISTEQRDALVRRHAVVAH